MRTHEQRLQPSRPGWSGVLARPGGAARGPEIHPLLRLQSTIGNQGVQRLVRDFARIPVHGIQAKLTVSTPGDVYEQEADRLADQVLRLPEPSLQRKCSCGGRCPKCQHQVGEETAAPPIVDEVLRSPGQPLDAETRELMESRFEHDFSRVRVHTDARAAESAQAVQARAYTVGSNIAFGAGQYAPRTPEGKRLLAHELTHVLQQSEGDLSLQRAVVTSGCDQLPYDRKQVEEAARRTYDDIKESDCIQNASLKEDVLDKLGSMKIVCKQGGNEGPCAQAEKPRTIKLYEAINKPSLCPAQIDPVLFHEAIHLTESFSLYHGNLSWDCGEACYPGTDERKRGDASKCAFERSPLPMVSVAGGKAFSGQGTKANYFRFYVGLEKRRPILSMVDLSLGIGASFIGETEGGSPGTEPSGTSALFSLIGALRFDPGKMGGGYLSLSGGPGAAFGKDRPELGGVVGVGAGYRWRMFDFSVNAGIDYNPTRKTGEETMYMLSASLSFAQKVRP